MLELVSKQLQFKIDGKVQSLRYPTVKDMKSLNARLKDDESNEIDVLVEMLIELGMEKELAEVLEVDHVNTIVKELTSSKKQ